MSLNHQVLHLDLEISQCLIDQHIEWYCKCGMCTSKGCLHCLHHLQYRSHEHMTKEIRFL